MRRSCAAAVLLLGGALTTAGPAAPAVITVSGTCDLLAAIYAANNDDDAFGLCPPGGSGADTIRLTGDVVLDTPIPHDSGPLGLLPVSSKITIEGNDFSIWRDFVSAPPFRILYVAYDGELVLEDLTIAFGLVDDPSPWAIFGAGIHSLGRLELHRVTIAYNKVEPADSGLEGVDIWGGGVYAAGPTSIYDSVFQSNSAITDGETSLAFGGGLAVMGLDPASIVNSTFDNNLVKARKQAIGGGMYHFGAGLFRLSGSTLSGNRAESADGSAAGGGLFGWHGGAVTNSTFSGNSAVSGVGSSYGAGLYLGSGTVDHATFHGNAAGWAAALSVGTGEVAVANSLFAESTGGHCTGAIVFDGGNLADDPTCGSVPDDLTELDLDPVLADNGGPTKTHKLLEDSSAIDYAGACGDVGTDQRGAGRGHGLCDSGAYEEIHCGWYEVEGATVDQYAVANICHTAILGSDVVITSDGDFTLRAGFLVTLKDGFVVEDGGSLEIETDPSLLPPLPP